MPIGADIGLRRKDDSFRLPNDAFRQLAVRLVQRRDASPLKPIEIENQPRVGVETHGCGYQGVLQGYITKTAMHAGIVHASLWEMN